MPGNPTVRSNHLDPEFAFSGLSLSECDAQAIQASINIWPSVSTPLIIEIWRTAWEAALAHEAKKRPVYQPPLKFEGEDMLDFIKI